MRRPAPSGPSKPVAAEFHEIHSDQSQVDDLTRHLADLHSIADANSVFSDQKEIADDGNENALHGDGETGGDEAGKGHDRTQLAGERKADDHDHQAPERDPAQQQELIATPRVLYIAQHRAPPDFGGGEHERQQHREHGHDARRAF